MRVRVSIHKESLKVTQKYRRLVLKVSTLLICIILEIKHPVTSSEDNGNEEVGAPRWWKLHLQPQRTLDLEYKDVVSWRQRLMNAQSSIAQINAPLECDLLECVFEFG